MIVRQLRVGSMDVFTYILGCEERPRLPLYFLPDTEVALGPLFQK
jgi:hypothetical protein